MVQNILTLHISIVYFHYMITTEKKVAKAKQQLNLQSTKYRKVLIYIASCFTIDTISYIQLPPLQIQTILIAPSIFFSLQSSVSLFSFYQIGDQSPILFGHFSFDIIWTCPHHVNFFITVESNMFMLIPILFSTSVFLILFYFVILQHSLQ